MRKQIDISLKYLSTESNTAELALAVIINGNCLHRLHSFGYANRSCVNMRPNTLVRGPIPGYSEMQDSSSLNDSITPRPELTEQGWANLHWNSSLRTYMWEWASHCHSKRIFSTPAKSVFLPQLLKNYGTKWKDECSLLLLWRNPIGFSNCGGDGLDFYLGWQKRFLQWRLRGWFKALQKEYSLSLHLNGVGRKSLRALLMLDFLIQIHYFFLEEKNVSLSIVI